MSNATTKPAIQTMNKNDGYVEDTPVDEATVDSSVAIDSTYKPIQSVSSAEQRLMEWDSNDEKNASFPDFIVKSLQESIKETALSEGIIIIGDADDYHNLASEFARQDLYKHAELVAKIGVNKYKYNADLLADIVKFGSQSQDWATCEKAYQRLCDIDFGKWTWRSFTFAIDYLLDLAQTLEPSKQQDNNKRIEALIQAYKQTKDERAWVADAKFLFTEGKKDAAIASLKDGVRKVPVSSQCCLKLSEYLLENGDYEGVIKYTAIGIRATAQEQPSASTAYLFYLSALAKDALINQENQKSNGQSSDNCDKGFHNLEAVSEALLDYKIARQIFSTKQQRTYLSNIKQREIILRIKSGIDVKDEENEEMQKTLTRMLYKKMLDNASQSELGEE